MCLYPKKLKISPKRQLIILKSQEEFSHRLRMSTWSNPTSDIMFRLAALAAFTTGRTDRQIFNLAKLNEGR
jgi:hypothetical protein